MDIDEAVKRLRLLSGVTYQVVHTPSGVREFVIECPAHNVAWRSREDADWFDVYLKAHVQFVESRLPSSHGQTKGLNPPSCSIPLHDRCDIVFDAMHAMEARLYAGEDSETVWNDAMDYIEDKFNNWGLHDQ